MHPQDVVGKALMPRCWVAITALLAAASTVMLAACTHLVFQPSRLQYSEPDRLGIVTEDVYLQSAAGVTLHGWRLPAAGQARGSVVFLHGNAENISSHIGSVYWLPGRGYEVFLFDYRGYGRSAGSADLDGVMYDAETMINYARRHAASGNRSVTVLGHSIGGSIAIAALARLEDKTGINGLITIGAFSDYHLIARDTLAAYWLTRPLRWPLSFTVSNRYRPADAIGKLSPIPVFILQAGADEIIPAYHAQQLFDAAEEPRFHEQLQGGHNVVLTLPDNQERLIKILDALNCMEGSTNDFTLQCMGR